MQRMTALLILIIALSCASSKMYLIETYDGEYVFCFVSTDLLELCMKRSFKYVSFSYAIGSQRVILYIKMLS
jgi:hypothetical protein